MLTTNPILYEIPMPIITPRLMIRPFRETDGPALTEAFIESINELKHWMPWAKHVDNDHASDSELFFIRNVMAKWLLREELAMLIVDKDHDENMSGAKIFGTIGFRTIDWAVPKMEIGYWLRTSLTGKGFMTEAVNAVTRYGFKQLNAQRIEIRCEENNIKSCAIPERLGFTRDAMFRNSARNADSQALCNTIIYACYDIAQLPKLEVTW